MKNKIGFKLGLIYLIVIAGTLYVMGLFVLQEFEEIFLQEKRTSLLHQANIAANRAVPFMGENADPDYLDYVARHAGEQMSQRVMVLDRNFEVLADSGGERVGETMHFEGSELAMEGQTYAQPHHFSELGWVYYLTVPVVSGREVAGAVFVSADLDHVYQQLSELRTRIVYVSLLTGGLIFVGSILLLKTITGKIKRLQQGVKKIMAGEYGHRVKMNGRDELAELGQAFDSMSLKIAQEDAIRRQFVANASHELKSPLAGIKALAEAAPRPGDSAEEWEEIRQDISREVERLNRLVEDLLALSRLEKNERAVRLSSNAVGELVSAAVKKVEPLAKPKGIKLEINEKTSDLYWEMDGEMIFRLLYNLLENSIKFSPPQSEVTVSYQKVQEEGTSWLSLQVADQGPGIPMEERENIFQRFYTLDQSRSREQGGTGLGLALVKEIVSLHGGKISVSGSSVFEVLLPEKPDE